MPTEPTPADKAEIVLRVPGSIANLGPGFDTLAVAVQLYLTLRVRRVTGQDRPALRVRQPDARRRKLHRARLPLHRRAPRTAHPLARYQSRERHPHEGRTGQQRRRHRRRPAALSNHRRPHHVGHNVVPVTEQELLITACELEGHPDNIAAALLGGLTVSCQMDGGLRVLRAAWPESLAIIVATPEQHLATKASRAVLPELISREDAIFNVQRVAFLLEALRTADFTLLRQALEDRLHQPYRAAIVPGLKEALSPASSQPAGSLPQRRRSLHRRLRPARSRPDRRPAHGNLHT